MLKSLDHGQIDATGMTQAARTSVHVRAHVIRYVTGQVKYPRPEAWAFDHILTYLVPMLIGAWLLCLCIPIAVHNHKRMPVPVRECTCAHLPHEKIGAACAGVYTCAHLPHEHSGLHVAGRG